MRVFVLLILTVFAMPVWAQRAVGSSSSAVSSKGSQVNADHSITFRYSDPGATAVSLQFDTLNNPVSMVKGATGVWSFTTAALPPEIYNYALSVDGQPRIDPSNRSISDTAIGPFFQSIEVPGAVPQPWDLTPIPHGELHTHTYTTHVVKGLPENQSSFIVYTPPGFDPRATKKYPVLYLLHGWSQTETGWKDLKANLILDSLIAAGKAAPMIVVMPLGYGDMSFLHNGFSIWNDAAAVSANVKLFASALLTEVLPQVEASYPVSKDRKDRAIVGLSMGGLEALLVGLNDTAQFASIGGFSAAVLGSDFDPFVANLDPKIADLAVLWIACGTGDNLLKSNRAFAMYLKGRGLPVTEIETPGRHVTQVWRDNLVHFAPLLFQGK